MKGELSPVAVIKLIFTAAILWASEGFITSINVLLKIVTLAPVSTRQTKHLSWSLALRKRPSSLAHDSFTFTDIDHFEMVSLRPSSSTSLGFHDTQTFEGLVCSGYNCYFFDSNFYFPDLSFCFGH